MENIHNMIEQLIEKFDRLRFTTREQSAFLEDFSTLIEDGVSPKDALELVVKITKDLKRKVANNLLQRLAKGQHLADGMADWFPHHIVEMVRSGEESGTLKQSMKLIVRTMLDKSGALSGFISSMLYPSTVLIAGLSVMVFMRHSVFKQFADIEPVKYWPASGQFLMKFSGLIQNWWWLILVIIILTIISTMALLKNYVGVYRRFIDALPILSLYRKLISARFMETLGMLIANGIVFKKSLNIIKHNSNDYLLSHLVMMERQLGMGKTNIADVLSTGMIDEEDVLRLQLVANVKGFEHALERQGKHAAENGLKTIRLIGKILGGALLALGAGLAVYLILTMYSVGSSLHMVA